MPCHHTAEGDTWSILAAAMFTVGLFSRNMIFQDNGTSIDVLLPTQYVFHNQNFPLLNMSTPRKVISIDVGLYYL